MKVTFITPPYNIIKSAYGSKSRINYGNLPPLGVLYIAGELRKYGHDVQLIDAAARSMSYEEIFDNIKQFRTDIIGISTMS
jgi:flavorubredoxin